DLLRGRGRFVDDFHLPGMLEAAFVRSPHAHARVKSIDVSAALAAPGVHAVFTLQDLPPSAQARLPLLVPNPAIRDARTQYCLAKDEVCFVGEALAIVVAQNRYLAEDAAAIVAVDYEPMQAAAGLIEALGAGAPTAHGDHRDNLAALVKMSYGKPDEAFAQAKTIVRETYTQHRGCAHPMETRGVLASFDSPTGQLNVWCSGQSPFLEKKCLVDLLAWDPERLRVINPDVGGGLGPKGIFYVEEAVVVAAAVKLQRPVKWIEDRREHFLATTQERDQIWETELALDANAKILGMRIAMTHDNGAYLPWGIILPWIAVTTTPGPYVVPNIGIDLKVVFTNKVPTTPVRGAGRPQGVFAMERILDKAAAEVGIGPDEIRRRNLVRPEQMPYEVGFIYRDGKPVIYDSGDYPACQAKALELADYAGFAERQARALKEGRYIGIGIGSYVEGTGLGPFEGATVRIQQTGRVTILTGAAPHGQGHKTTFAQICADHLGVGLDQIDVITADTNAVSMGIGTFASRTTVNAGNSVHIAGQMVRQKLLKLAASLMEASEADLELSGGRVSVKGVPGMHKTFGELARTAQGMPGFSFPEGVSCGLEHTEYFSPERSTYCNGTHVAEVEVDIRTGYVKILRYSVAHDSGRLINPLIVDGQVQGGVAHGIGNALLEWMGYDENAQPVTTNFGEYLMPMATDVPKVDMAHLETPSPLNPLGVKGAGEGGTIPAAAAITAAIENALEPFGVKLAQTPVFPQRIVELLAASGAYAKPAQA
ncbi:MAG: xanthine dehydrogenase family protein, partial [Betaproteobacteria bacterium]|nr:xanthine dehydrogenase family protein [Betaproteobacteria bacterium]